jgi:uncharacterized protein (TIGR00297 family)
MLWTAVAVTVIFAAAARLLRGVTRSGAIVGALLAFIFFAGAGASAFMVLIALFALTWLTTRLGYAQKQRSGTAEKSDGRGALQVLANLGTAALAIVAFVFTRNAGFLVSFVAALSEAAADTVSSESGQALSGSARLITTGEPVPAGTDGGITALGTLGGCLAAITISAISAAVGLIPLHFAWIPALAGTIGMLADSILGAVFERRGLLTNDAVNFSSTLIAAFLAFGIWILL